MSENEKVLIHDISGREYYTERKNLKESRWMIGNSEFVNK